MKIFYPGNNETLKYAAEELEKYIHMMDKAANVCITEQPDGDISLGLLSDFNLPEDGIEDAWCDDLIDIHIEKGKGYIAGSNHRSVLFGVYTYLKSAGCVWTRPGKDGDYVPEFDILNHSFVYRKSADMRFRGQMIEGAISVEHAIDSVEWMAKLGYNSFCIQFVHPYGFYKRWHRHVYNPLKTDENISLEEMEKFTYQIEKAVKKRGLLLHNLGHGYLFEPFGISYTGGRIDDVPAEIKQYIALVNGKRELIRNSVNVTQLCYSNPKVRKMLVEYLVKFMKTRKLTDVLHVYFSDSVNNHCECDECKKLIPTDYFIMILNDLDAAFTKEGINTKILFDFYGDVLWPPTKERFNNPDRIIVSAAIKRDYSEPLPEKKIRKIPEYKRNQYNPFGGEAKTTFDFVEAWRPYFNGKFISITYNMYADHFYDPGYCQVCDRIVDDIKRYPGFDCNGQIDCQTMRFGFPNALPGAIMGDFTFDISLDLDTYKENYYKGSYGKDWKQVKEYFEKLTDLFCPNNLRMSEDVIIQDTTPDAEVAATNSYIKNEYVQKKLSEVPAFIDTFSKTVENNLNSENPCHKLSWKYLEFYGKYCKLYSEYFLYLSKLDVESAYETAEELIKWLFENEDFLGRHFDIYLLNLRILRVTVIRMRRKLGLPETIELGEY